MLLLRHGTESNLAVAARPGQGSLQSAADTADKKLKRQWIKLQPRIVQHGTPCSRPPDWTNRRQPGASPLLLGADVWATVKMTTKEASKQPLEYASTGRPPPETPHPSARRGRPYLNSIPTPIPPPKTSWHPSNIRPKVNNVFPTYTTTERSSSSSSPRVRTIGLSSMPLTQTSPSLNGTLPSS